MGSCVAFGCTNSSAQKLIGISFHCFPKNEERKKLWIHAMRRENWNPTKHSKVCSAHFPEEMMDRTSLSIVRLRENAVPIVNTAFPPHLQKKKLLTMASKDTPLSSGTDIKVKSEPLDDSPSSSNNANKNEEDILQMDVDCNVQPNDEENDSLYSMIKIDTTVDGLTELSVESPYFDVSGEEVIMSPEDVRKYLDSKIKEYIIDAEVNKLMKLYKRSLELKEVLREKNEEYLKIQKLMEMIFRNQERFLRQGGILPKIPTYSRGISVDLPFLSPTESLKLPKLFFDSNAAQSKTVATSKPALNSSLACNPSPVPVSNPPTPSPSASKASIECIDLTDEQDSSDKHKGPGSPRSVPAPAGADVHPAPLPPRPYSAPNESYLRVPPRPRLQVKGDSQGIVLQWDMSSTYNPKVHSQVTAYEIFGYQVLPKNAVCTLLWKKIGTVKAMTLPMACTLTQFQEGNKYFFAIRAVDLHNRCSHFSEALSIIYNSRKEGKVAK